MLGDFKVYWRQIKDLSLGVIFSRDAFQRGRTVLADPHRMYPNMVGPDHWLERVPLMTRLWLSLTS